MTDTENKKTWTLSRLRTTWEYKSLAFIMRATVALCVVAYLLMTASAIWPGLQTSYARTQPASAFPALLDNALASGDFSWAWRWLNARPGSEAGEHSATLQQHIEKIPALMISTIIRSTRNEDNIEQTRFWTMYMQFRMRFDVLRCGIPSLIDTVSQINLYAQHLQGDKDPLAPVRANPEQMAALLQKILDYDADHPMHNTPRLTCDILTPFARNSAARLSPEESWATIRHTLRIVTETAIRDMKAQKPAPDHNAGTTTKPATP